MEMASHKNERRSLEDRGLVLPFKLWLVLVVVYLASMALLWFVGPAQHAELRAAALAVAAFIMGIFFAFKAALWINKEPRN